MLVSYASTVVTYYPNVEYRHFIEGQSYSCDDITYYQVGFNWHVTDLVFDLFTESAYEKAEKMTKPYPKGRRVTIYYFPADPSIAVLNPGIAVGGWFDPIFLVLITCGSNFLLALSLLGLLLGLANREWALENEKAMETPKQTEGRSS